MAKTIVVKDSNFSENKIETVTFIEVIPCTAISLSSGSASLNAIGATETLTATVTPSDTTDSVSWATSDNTVASVASGVITAVGVGTATITAMCGTRSATATVTVRAFMDTDNVAEHIGYQFNATSVNSGESGLSAWNYALNDYGGYYSDEGELRIYIPTDPEIYPYILPQNTNRVRVTVKQGSNINSVSKIGWYNSQTAATGQTGIVECIAEANKGVSSFDYVDAQGNKYHDFAVPTITDLPSIDSIIICFRSYGYTFTSSMLEDITIEFLPAETA